MAIFNPYSLRVPAGAYGGSYFHAVRFRSTVAGELPTLAVYKHTSTANITARVFTDAGVELASKLRASDGFQGWVYLTFTAPVPISAGTYYVAGAFRENVVMVDTGPSNHTNAFQPVVIGADSVRYAGSNIFPTLSANDYIGMDLLFEDLGNYSVPPFSSPDVVPGCNSLLKGIKLDGQDMYPGAVRSDVEGFDAPPCLKLPIPGFYPFRWGVEAGTRTVTISAKQVSDVVGKRPRMIIKADTALGVNADIVGDAPAGAGWVTIGPLTITPTSSGVLKVELWNMDTATFDSPAFFDHRIVT